MGVAPPRVRHNAQAMSDQVRALASELIVWVILLGAFGALASLHFVDQRRRRVRRGRIRDAGDWGPHADAVELVLAAASALRGEVAERLAARRRAAFAWDPRLEREPKAARAARARAFENERDDRSLAAADEARARAVEALGIPPGGRGRQDASPSREAAECAAETAGAIVAVERIPSAEFRMLTRAWREVVGPIDVRAAREA